MGHSPDTMNPSRARLYQWQIARGNEVDESLRERAFLPLLDNINGVVVKQFTLRHLTILSYLQSPFIYGGIRRIEDVGQFLWVVSPHYQAEPETIWIWREQWAANTLWSRIRRMIVDRWNRRWNRKLGMEPMTVRAIYMRQLTQHPRWERFYRAIDRYLQRTFRDPPPMIKNGKQIAACYAAGVIHKIAKAYGWDDETIMDKPLIRIFQYLKWIQVDDNPATPQFNPMSDRIKSRFSD